MRTPLLGLGAMLALALSATSASAQYSPPYPPYYNSSCCVPYIPKAPDAMGPGTYAYNCYGQIVGPNYNLTPCFGPWNGALFPPGQASGQAGGQNGFPTHPFARSPRDFFMYYEREQEWSPYNRGAR